MTLKIYYLKWFGLTSFVHFKAKLYPTKCNEEIVNDVTFARDDNTRIKPHKNVPVGSFRNRDEETNKMTRDVINNITLVCHDNMLIKAQTKVLRETNETHRGKLDKETNEKTIEVATLVILVLDEDIIIKAHTNVLDPYASSPISIYFLEGFLSMVPKFIFSTRMVFLPSFHLQLGIQLPIHEKQ